MMSIKAILSTSHPLSSPPAQRGERIKVRGVSPQDSLLLHRAPPSLTLPHEGGGDDLLNASTA
jgi:hypothetical protein